VKFGAIDIGSNAVRLLIARVDELEDGRKSVDKLSFYRVPVRLGADVFSDGAISEDKTRHLVKTMKAFWYLMDVQGVEWFHAYATSAMREASNVESVIKKVHKGANIKIEPISGDHEAELIFGNFAMALMDGANDYLYIDVGGGSTELTLIREGERIKSKSFQLGTVRHLAGRIPDGEWTAVEEFVTNLQSEKRPLFAIGTGGNANRLQRLALTPRDEAIPKSQLQGVSDQLSALSVEDRRAKYHLRPDRADVIVPAAEIYLRIMDLSGSSHMFVPKVGLVDGMVLDIHQKWKEEKADRAKKKAKKKKEGQ
jgi:exopolyphosphatase/guanosine-5'-triphosphate,3'-diphosphate pyrophosphatase